MKHFLKTKRRKTQTGQAGFGLTEVALSVAAGSLLITGGAVAVRSVSSSMQASSQITGLRSSATTGLRFLRAETQRSEHLIIDEDSQELENEYAYLDHTRYSSALNKCGSMAGYSEGDYNPLFGLKLAQLSTPVFYSFGVSTSGKNYALYRCGPTVSSEGQYEKEEITFSHVFDGIGVVPCGDNQCPVNPDLSEIAKNTDNSLIKSSSGNDDEEHLWSKPRVFPEPAFAIETDSVGRLLKLKDPTTDGDDIFSSFLEAAGNRRNLRVDLNFTAYARAKNHNYSSGAVDMDAQPGCSENEECTFFGIPINSDKVQFVVDGSGSMSSCIAWGGTIGVKPKVYYDPDKGYYIWSREDCLLTRMESLQIKLKSILASLSDSTSISLQSFSSPGSLNNREWNEGKMTALNDSNRESAIEFVDSLSNGNVTEWGGTKPWAALDKAFDNEDSNAVYFMTDGDPNSDRNGGSWGKSDYQRTADAYIAMNKSRNLELSVNTVSVGQKSRWLKLLSDGAGGTYKVINQ